MLTVADIGTATLRGLLDHYGLTLVTQASDEDIRGSFWGDSEAGIIESTVYVRPDTPIHSLLHETSHIICMSAERRAGLNTDAGGGDLEEAAVCYMQILLAGHIDGVGAERLMQDMDSWGYSFRLGSTRRWFDEDAEDAMTWLQENGLVAPDGGVTFRLR